MQIFNGIIEHTQGESFTLDMLVEYPNGNPYIISSQLINPYILFTIASSQYDQNDRYIMRHWLDTRNEDGSEKFPRFYQTRPNERLIGNPDIEDAATFFAWANINLAAEDWDPATGLTRDVYQLNNNTYWYGKGLFVDGALTELQSVHPYELRIVLYFSHEETSLMTGQKYVYFIEGIDGVDLNVWLRQECYDNKFTIEESFLNIAISENQGVITIMDTENGFPENISEDTPALYNLILAVKPEALEGISITQPVVITDATHNDVIVNDGEWKVITNINGRGLNKWQIL